jgi:hypothetical protein
LRFLFCTEFKYQLVHFNISGVILVCQYYNLLTFLERTECRQVENGGVNGGISMDVCLFTCYYHPAAKARIQFVIKNKMYFVFNFVGRVIKDPASL